MKTVLILLVVLIMIASISFASIDAKPKNTKGKDSYSAVTSVSRVHSAPRIKCFLYFFCR